MAEQLRVFDDSRPDNGDALRVVYTDGACQGNPGPGGWAWAEVGGPWASGAEAHTTNQRMELTAVLEALRGLDGRLEVVSDSSYVVNCFRDRWWAGWRRRNWRNSRGEAVANRDLWEPLIELALERRAAFRWGKGHGVDPMNALVDRLAVEAASTQRAAAGTNAAP
jgi:ribonuclease HI